MENVTTAGYMDQSIFLIIGVITLLIVWFALSSFWLTRYRTVPPNKLLIAFGKKHIHPVTGEQTGYRLIKGGGTFIFPIIESFLTVPFEIMSINISDFQAYDKFNKPLSINFTAHIKYLNNSESMYKFTESSIKKSREEMEKIPMEILENKIRLIFENISLKDGINRNELIRQIKEVANADMGEAGMELTLLNLRKINFI